MEYTSLPYRSRKQRRNRLLSAAILALSLIAGLYIGSQKPQEEPPTLPSQENLVSQTDEPQLAISKTAVEGLAKIPVKGRSPKTGYTRTQFGNGWQKNGECDTRNAILARDFTVEVFDVDGCTVLSGTLQDPYTGDKIDFVRGKDTSDKVQIDHVVALSDAWQTGAQLLSTELRQKLANDGLNLLAVDGPTNQNKSDGDAATWLPPNKPFRCAYVARQISVKIKYSLWVKAAEKDSMERVLKNCPNEPLIYSL